MIPVSETVSRMNWTLRDHWYPVVMWSVDLVNSMPVNCGTVRKQCIFYCHNDRISFAHLM